jgi:Domain of unknown function (DU1801)
MRNSKASAPSPTPILRRPFASAAVAQVFASYPHQVRDRLLEIRQLVFDVAAAAPGVGDIEETLKWGQPSYLTTKTKSGSLIRIDQLKNQAGAYGVYFHCQTTLVDTFREMYRDVFTFDGNRCIVFSIDDVVPIDALGDCIAVALTYRLKKRAIA